MKAQSWRLFPHDGRRKVVLTLSAVNQWFIGALLKPSSAKYMSNNRLSLWAFWLSCLLIALSSLVYYPKWKQGNTEATISWDVSGYYLYLPAVFIYHDIRQLHWRDSIEQRYHMDPGMGQAIQHPSGNYVMKYPMGQALQFLPWFTIAHALAVPLGFPADGFSLPYQAAISWGSLLVAFLGLWFLRKVLLRYFTDGIAAAVLVSIVFGSNYLEYAGITGAMTHNWLFTLNSLLLFATIRFYDKPGYWLAAAIGLLTGWATLTRPTEIISILIPLLWGVSSKDSLRARVALLRAHWPKLALAGIAGLATVSLQMIYWNYASGHWVVYSYEKQGFTWFPPHIEDVLWSSRAGWLVYSPMMIFAIAGLFMLRKKVQQVFPAVFLYCLTALYITSAWDIWWYGGSLGQRAMVQAYPFWAFALGAFWSWVSAAPWRRPVFCTLGGVCIYLNLWWSHQAHFGGVFQAEQMTRHYILKTLGRFQIERDWMKFLDTRDEFTGDERQDVKVASFLDFEADTTAAVSTVNPVSGAKSTYVNGQRQYTDPVILPNPGDPYNWCRATVTFKCEPKEWDWWAMTQFVVRFKSGEKIVKERMIRLQRHVEGGENKTIWFDTRFPSKSFDSVQVFFWNAESRKTVRLDDLKVEFFRG